MFLINVVCAEGKFCFLGCFFLNVFVLKVTFWFTKMFFIKRYFILKVVYFYGKAKLFC